METLETGAYEATETAGPTEVDIGRRELHALIEKLGLEEPDRL